jgi:hypothetical protein
MVRKQKLIYKTECASIVYGRTYEVDFRFVELPSDFKQNSSSGFEIKEQYWLESHIRSSTLAAEKLPKKPRWSIFKNDKYSVVGITCMADEVANEKTKDRESRPLYVFLGYVFRYIDLPMIPMDLSLFKDLYRSISDLWEVKAYELAGKEPIWSSYQERSFDLRSNEPTVRPSRELNLNPQKVLAWADSEEHRRVLWAAGLNCQYPASICLGLPNKNTALKGIFLNGSILDLPSVTELTREPIEHTRELESSSTDLDMAQDVAIDRKPKKEQKNQPSQTNERHPIQQNSNSQTRSPRKSLDRFEQPINHYEGDEWVPPLDETNSNSAVEEFKQNLADLFQQIEDFPREITRQIFNNEPQSSDDRDKKTKDNLDRDPSTHPKRGSGKQKSSQVESSQTESELGIGFKPKKKQKDNSEDNKDWF